MSQTPPPHPRVLQLSYACSPEHGSEGGRAWCLALEMARRFETWVIVADNYYAEAIRRYLAAHGDIPQLHFVFVPDRPWQHAVSWLPGSFYLHYKAWQWQAYLCARQLHQRLKFDLVHQVSFCGFREPGYSWKLDAPFVWGPLGGTQNYPWRFLTQAGARGAVAEGLRTVCNELQFRFSPRVRQAIRRTSVLMTANSTGQRDFARVHGVTPLLLLETGVRALAAARQRDPNRREVRILWSGQFEPRKCLPLLLRAFGRAAPPASTIECAFWAAEPKSGGGGDWLGDCTSSGGSNGSGGFRCKKVSPNINGPICLSSPVCATQPARWRWRLWRPACR